MNFHCGLEAEPSWFLFDSAEASGRGKAAMYHVNASCERQGYGPTLSQILRPHGKVT